MEANSQKDRLQKTENSDSASDKEDLCSPTQQDNVRFVGKGPEIPDQTAADVFLQTVIPVEESQQPDDGQETDHKSSKERLHTNEDLDSSSAKEFCPSPKRQSHLQVEAKHPGTLDLESEDVLDVLTTSDIRIPKTDAEEDTTITTGKDSFEVSRDAKAKMEGMPKVMQETGDSFVDETHTERANTSQYPEKASPEATTIPTSFPETEIDFERDFLRSKIFKHLDEMTSDEEAFAEELELCYMDQYSSRYSKELLFAIDVTMLLRHLHGFEIRYIIFASSGEQPISPCDATMDDAIAKLWNGVKDDLRAAFTSRLHSKGLNYKIFQELAIDMADETESQPYEERSFLMYCITLAHWAVEAEIYCVPNAISFVPLVISRTVKKFKSLEVISTNFWERLAETALSICLEE